MVRHGGTARNISCDPHGPMISRIGKVALDELSCLLLHTTSSLVVLPATQGSDLGLAPCEKC